MYRSLEQSDARLEQIAQGRAAMISTLRAIFPPLLVQIRVMHTFGRGCLLPPSEPVREPDWLAHGPAA